MNEFDKIIGYEKEKVLLMQICDMIKNRQLYVALGVNIPRGVMLEGKPGIGKTLMAKCFIKEAGISCFECRKELSDGAFVDKIKELFDSAKKNAPSIIFFDDIDKFAEDCSGGTDNKEEFVAIQSGMESVKDAEVFVLATANNLHYLPESLMRAGRFDRIISIDLPSNDEAVKIISNYLKNKKVADDVAPDEIVRLMSGNSCAELETVLNEAGIYAGFERKDKIEFSHIVKAVLGVIHHVTDIPNSFKSAYIEQLAYHEAGHCVASLYFNRNSMGLLTICPQWNKRGFFIEFDDGSKDLYQDYKRNLIITLAGKAASELKFGEFDAGTAYDVNKAEQIIREHLEDLGYDNFNCVDSCFNKYSSPSRNNLISEKLTLEFNKHYEMAKAILERHFVLVEKVVDALLEKRVLTSRDMNRILENYNAHGDGFN